MNRTQIVLILFSLLFSHLTSASDDNIAGLSLEDLLKTKVYTSSKQTEEITVAPGIISLITQRQIEAYGADNLLQLLDRVSSSYALGSYLFPQNVLSLRGDLASHFNNHVLLLIDGRPIRESLTGGVDIAVYLSFPINSISHIEVVRGPGSVLYGTNAFAGVVNIVTLQLRNERTEISIGAGEFSGKSLSILNQNDVNDHHLTFGLQYHKDDGWSFESFDETGQQVDEDYAQNNLGANFKWHFNEWQLSAFYGQSEQTNLGAIPIISLGLPNKAVDTSRGFIDLQYEKQVSDAWYSSYNLTYNQFSEMIDVAGSPFDGKSSDWLLETNQRFNLSPEWQLLTGASIYNQNGRAIQAESYAVPKYNETWYRAFAEFTWLSDENSRLVLGTQANK
ncbi:MAG: TonB-dependent receptor plug domain-containing protein, partial [Kangiellaceae bacterium]|nr:TonB-dependent receptor plug domain-containing protein [Kangiellaceae bacterium]